MDVNTMVEWGKAFEVFLIGFGGVITTLVILQLGIGLFSKFVSLTQKHGDKS